MMAEAQVSAGATSAVSALSFCATTGPIFIIGAHPVCRGDDTRSGPNQVGCQRFWILTGVWRLESSIHLPG